MIAVNPEHSIVRKSVTSVEFGFYTDKDVRERSVIEITSPQAFDPTNNALPGGLYDPRMGATASSKSSCVTCALPFAHCPGHFGHIELVVPVYHPLLFMDIVKILRIKCLHCHKLRATPRQLSKARAKFMLLYQHRIQDLIELDQKLSIALREGRDHELDDESPAPKKPNKSASLVAEFVAMDAALQRLQPTREEWDPSQPHRRQSPSTQFTSYERSMRRQLIAETYSTCKTKSCPHCGAHIPTIRNDASNKIFQSWSKTALRSNAAEGLVIDSAMSYTTTKTATQRRREKDGYESEDSRRGIGADDDDDNEDVEMTAAVDDNDDDVAKGSNDKFMHCGEVQAQLQRTWQSEPFLCNCLFGTGASFDITSYQIYFLQAIPVPPSRFRPPMHLNGMTVEHSHTQFLSKILQSNELVRSHFAAKNERLAYTIWMDLQTAVNVYMDSSKDPRAAAAGTQAAGIRQLLERKEGLFRKNMMGKRVDHACRSVISPDPYVGTNEIGLPRYFASILTYPTPVTDRNIKEMRSLVERGPHAYPGARWVEVLGKRIDLSKMEVHKREAIAAQLLTHLKRGVPALVGRQLRDGDYVLMNRQPTLHKPGIMAHKVRVLFNQDQKTIRMHYANCNTYNADFDGDEMNCHFPQSDLGQAEARYIAQTDLQYIVPTDGSPLRGLIQDHVVGGVKLTTRDTFLEKWQYQQLLFAALASLPGLEVIQPDMNIELLPPAIIKPREFWTGKQVISTLLLHLRRSSIDHNVTFFELPGLSTERKAKTPESAFGADQEEHLILIREGELLRGVLDKSAFGATEFSLVHAAFEAYGPEKAGLLLNALGRLFTAYIQYFVGHSCRMEDLVLTKEADEERRKLVNRAYIVGSRAAKAWADSDGGKVAIPTTSAQPQDELPLKPFEAASASAKIGMLLSGKEGAGNFAALDSYMQGKLNPLSSNIVAQCLPKGLAVPFPYNSFSIMTTTGAKGSIVNQSQVSCALGQQALEGRRVPRLSSGRTLPSFAAYDANPRADGFVLDRFLTGIRPQEYYFHCMAGREGLVDTAVKTSRSGYLQRCLIKHLEELKIQYDYTVRNSEGGVVQFLYGEDGLDTTKATYLDCSEKSFEFFVRNYESVKRLNAVLPHSSIVPAAKDVQMLRSPNFLEVGNRVLARKLRTGTEWRRGAICRGWHDAIIMKVHKADHVDLQYIKDGQVMKKVPIEIRFGSRASRTLSTASDIATIIKPTVSDPILTSLFEGHRIGCSGACISEKVAFAAHTSLQSVRLQNALKSCQVTSTEFSELVGAKYSSSLCYPGEAVGCIAAQSVGEPSTQMTLNTFHLAGSGANLTLGIPRLREIIMTASRNLKTPTMSVPLLNNVTEKKALRLTRDFSKLTLLELILSNRGISVTERLEKGDAGEWMRSYYVVLKFHPADRIRSSFGLSLHDIAGVVTQKFSPLLCQLMKRELRRSSIVADVIGGQATTYAKKSADDDASNQDEVDNVTEKDLQGKDINDDDDDNDLDDDDDNDNEEDGVDASRRKQRSTMQVSYDDDAEEDDVSESEITNGQEQRLESTGQLHEPDDGDDSITSTPFDSFKTLAGPNVDKAANKISLPPLQVDPVAPPLLMVGLVETAAAKIMVRSRKGIEQAFINNQDGIRRLETLGVNFPEFWKLDSSIVDHDRLASNDIWAICCSYGVEAARSNIVQQIKNVFGAYGIEVNSRHLSLIADFMTFNGDFKAMNRGGIESCSSPFLQMSFETTLHFLRQAAMSNDRDNLASPSGNIVLGKPILHGTGAFDLLACTM